MKKTKKKIILYVDQQTKDFVVKTEDDRKTEKQKPKKEKKRKMTDVELQAEQIWDNLDKIDLDFASVGFSSTNRIIYSYDLVFELMISLGYSYEATRLFLEQFSESLKDSKEYPILMNSIGRLNILAMQKKSGS